MIEASRQIIMYVTADCHPADIERLAADYGYIVTNPRRHGDGITLLHKDGTRFIAPPGTDIWISELVASEHEETA